MSAAQIVMRDIQRDRCNVIIRLLWEAIGKAREPAAAHAQRKVLPLNVARWNVLLAASRWSSNGLYGHKILHGRAESFDRFFRISKYLTVNHIYHPLAASSGNILTLLRALRARGGDQKAKLFQFLNQIGARALRIQLGRILEMAQSSPDRLTYERKIVDRFGGQKEFEFMIPPQPETKEAAN